MKNILLTVVLTTLLTHAFSQEFICIDDLGKRKGEIVKILGKVEQVYYNPAPGGLRSTNLVLTSNQQDQVTIVFKDTSRFSRRDLTKSNYLNQYIQVSGKVELIRKKLQITVSDKTQIYILPEGYKNGFLADPE